MLQLAKLKLFDRKPIRLDFENLKAFEEVRDRYRHLGVMFANAIALKPSNPAFIPQSGTFVLMPVGSQMAIDAYFEEPVSLVGTLVYSSTSVILKAYDRHGNYLGQSNTANSPLMPNFELRACPIPLELNLSGIAKVELQSCTPFTVAGFFFARLL